MNTHQVSLVDDKLLLVDRCQTKSICSPNSGLTVMQEKHPKRRSYYYSLLETVTPVII